MRTACQPRIITLLLALVAFATWAWANDPVDEANWLDEATWPAFVAPRDLKITDKDDLLTKLLNERYNSGQQELRNRYVYWLQGEESLPQVYDAARRVIEARLEVGGPGADIVAITKEKVAFAKVVEKQSELVLKKFNRARQAADVDSATYFRATAEVELIRAEKAAKRDAAK
jgi:hypothetical protein